MSDHDLIRRGDVLEAVYDQHPEWTRDAIAALPADPRVAKLVEALRGLVQLNDDYSTFGGELLRDRVDRTWQRARAAIAAWEAGK